MLALSNGRDAVALCCERRRASRLEDFAALEKLGEVQPPPQEGAGGPAPRCCAYLGFAGLAADGRRLLDRARLFSENYRLRHGEDAGVQELALFIAGGWSGWSGWMGIGGVWGISLPCLCVRSVRIDHLLLASDSNSATTTHTSPHTTTTTTKQTRSTATPSSARTGPTAWPACWRASTTALLQTPPPPQPCCGPAYSPPGPRGPCRSAWVCASGRTASR